MQISFPPVEENNETRTHPPVFPFNRAVRGSCRAESCYSRWSPLFGDGPDHVTTKWWKLWAVFQLSISTDRLAAGNRQATRKYIHALRRRRTETPKPQQWWVDGSYSVKIKRREKVRHVVFSLTASRQEERGREGGAAVISTVVLWIWSSSSIHYGGCSQELLMILYSESRQCVPVCSFCICVCVRVFAHTVHIPVNHHYDVISTVQESSTQSVQLQLLMQSYLFQAESSEEEQGCFLFMRTSTWLTVNLHLCPICAQASMQPFNSSQR